MKIAVLLGGKSSEREISIRSGEAAHEALLSKGLNVVRIDVSEDPVKQMKNEDAQLAFIALHGKFGEDGTIQQMLEEAAIPYTGSGPEASRLAMDKLASRKIFEAAGLPVPDFTVLSFPQKPAGRNGDRYLISWKNQVRKLGICPHFSPVVVKPNREGSSIGMSVVKHEKGMQKALDEAFRYDDTVIVEEFIQGDDMAVGMLNDMPLPVLRIKPRHGVYDYAAKYTDGMTEYEVPAKLDNDLTKQAQEYGKKAHELLGCRNFSRVDMRLGKNEQIMILEVNTIPGLTANSLLPKAAKATGMDFAQMCLRMVETIKIKV